jgi:zinc protease
MPTTKSWTAGVVREVLPNGLTLLAQRDPSAPAVAVVTHVKAGFFDEPDRWAGISHVLEHMFFKGTPTRGVGEVARQTKAAGGYLNAGTAYDYTTYYVTLPAAELEAALEIQADALQHATLDGDELARELQVIIQEAKRKLDSPGSLAHETLHEVLFDQHRIRRWRIGTEEALAGFTRDDVAGYYESRYVPDRTIVAIVGDVDPADALRAARARYASWPARAAGVDPSPDEPPRRDVRARTLRGPITLAQLVLGWRTVSALHPDAAALDLAAAVLGSGRGSWLYRSVRAPGLATGISAFHYSPTEVGVFSISAELEPERLPAALDEIAKAVLALRSAGPTDADIERARALLLTQWGRRLETMDGRASALASAEALRDVALLDEEFAQLSAVTPADVQRVTEQYLLPDSVGAVAYLPDGRGSDLEVGALTAAFRRPVVVRAAPGTEPIPSVRRVNQRPGGQTTAGVLHVPLAGADLLLRRKTGVPAVSLGAYVRRSGAETPAEAGLGSLALRSAIRGAGAYDAEQLALAFERLGGSLGATTATDWLGMGTTVMSEGLAPAAALLRLALDEPRLAESEVTRERDLMCEEARQVADDTFRYPFQLAFRGAFGDSAYGLPASGLEETLQSLTPARVGAWHRDAVRGHRLSVVAVGDFEPERAADDLTAVFGDWRSESRASESPVIWIPGASPVERVVELGKAQSAFAMLFPGPARRDPRRYAAEVWAAVASGLGGRLFDALRDQRSLAYTVLAFAWPRLRAGALGTYIAMAPEREDEAREAMLEELARFANEAVTPDELRGAIGYLAGQAAVQRQSAGHVSSEIVDAWMLGQGLEELEDPGAPYRRVTAEAVWEVARESLVPERRAEGVVRGTGGGR